MRISTAIGEQSYWKYLNRWLERHIIASSAWNVFCPALQTHTAFCASHAETRRILIRSPKLRALKSVSENHCETFRVLQTSSYEYRKSKARAMASGTERPTFPCTRSMPQKTTRQSDVEIPRPSSQLSSTIPLFFRRLNKPVVAAPSTPTCSHSTSPFPLPSHSPS